MITPSQIRERKISTADEGYDRNEVNELLVEIIESYETVCAENKELYRKMEILASKIEEYREDEDSIKTAIISAQKMAHQIKAEANADADKTISESNAAAQQTIKDAQEKAEKLIGEARDYVAGLTRDKSEAAQLLVTEAETKANAVISSAKLVAQDTIDNAKELTKQLVDEAKQEREKEELLLATIKADSCKFKADLIGLYQTQLETLQAPELKPEDSSEEILSELEELSAKLDAADLESLPQVETEETEETAAEEVAEEPALDEEAAEVEEKAEDEEEITEVKEVINLEEEITDEEDLQETIFALDDSVDEVDEIILEIEHNEPAFEVIEEEEEENLPPTQEEIEDALNAFSDNEITPVEGTGATIPVINEEPEFDAMPFESFFNIDKVDVNTNETISLTAPDEDDDDEDDKSKFRGFFKKRK